MPAYTDEEIQSTLLDLETKEPVLKARVDSMEPLVFGMSPGADVTDYGLVENIANTSSDAAEFRANDYTDTKFSTMLADAEAAAEQLATDKANLAETTSKAYADGIVTLAEAAAIAAAEARVAASKITLEAYADGIVSTSEALSIEAAEAEANAAVVRAKAYADGIVTTAEAELIAAAEALALEAKEAANAYTDGVVVDTVTETVTNIVGDIINTEVNTALTDITVEMLDAAQITRSIQNQITQIDLEKITQLADLGLAQIEVKKVEAVSEKGFSIAETTSFALITESEARAGEITRVESQFNDSTAVINQALLTNSNATSSVAQSLSSLSTSVDNINANYVTQSTVNASIDGASVTILQAASANFNTAIAGYATEGYADTSASNAAAGNLTTIDSRFDENTGVYGQQIKTAVDAADAATSVATALSAGIYDGSGNLSQAFIDEVSLVAVEADGTTIASAISAYTVSAGGNTYTLEQLAQASIDSDGGGYEAQWGVSTTLSGLKNGVGFYVDGGVTSFVVTANNFIIREPGTSNTDTLPFVFTGGQIYIDTAKITNLTSSNISAGAITSDKIRADAINGKTITGATVQTSVTGTRVVIGDSSYPLWYGDGTLSANNGKFYVDDTGLIYAKDITIDGSSTFEGELIAATGTFSGDISAASGSFTGTIYAENIEGDVVDVNSYNYYTYDFDNATSYETMLYFAVHSESFDRTVTISGLQIEWFYPTGPNVFTDGCTIQLLRNDSVVQSVNLYQTSYPQPPTFVSTVGSGDSAEFKLRIKALSTGTAKAYGKSIVSVFKKSPNISFSSGPSFLSLS